MAGLVAAGVASLAAGQALDAMLMPINKNLWTPSYCLFINGWSLLLLAAFWWSMDGNGSAVLRERARHWLLPLTAFGMNALFLFVLSGLIARLLIAVRITQYHGGDVSLKALLFAPLSSPAIDPALASLAFAIVFDLAMFGVAWLMWRKRWFVKV
jgi:predicted acyltransferase